MFLKAHPDLKFKTTSLIGSLAVNPFNPKNKSHKLGGVLKGKYGAHINLSYRIVFILTHDEITLVNVGSHDEVYRN